MVQKCDRQLMEVICRSSKAIFGVAWLYSEDGGYSLGKDGVSKIDVFSEIITRAIYEIQIFNKIDAMNLIFVFFDTSTFSIPKIWH